MSRHAYGAQRWRGERHTNLSIDKSLQILRYLLKREDPRGATSTGMLDVEEWSALEHLAKYARSCARGRGQ